jgi:hypothetical protein
MRSLVPMSLLFALAAPVTERPGEIRLFNGKDLAGWTYFLEKKGPNADGSMKMQDVWSVDARHGVLRCTGVPNGYLRTTADYESYVLRLEWRWPAKPANSGVFLRLVGEDKIWPKAIEAQLQSGNAGDIWLIDDKTLDVAPAHLDPKADNHRLKSKANERPAGQWNEYEIAVDGDRVVLKVNGEVLNEGTGAEKVAGKIGLQSEGGPIEFRNIRLTPIGK